MPDPIEISNLNASVSDQAAAKDALGFSPYVSAMAEFLTNPQTKPPLTLSVEGEWGSGKSSFMKQLQKAIEESSQKEQIQKLENFEKSVRRFLYRIFYGLPKKLEPDNRVLYLFWIILWFFFQILLFSFSLILLILIDGLKWRVTKFKRKPRTVWFNAWRHDKAEALWAAFALEFIRQISMNRGISDVLPTFWGHCKLFWSRFSWKEGFLDFLRKVAQVVLGISAIAMIIIFVISQGQGWVKKLSEKVNQINTELVAKSDQNKKTEASKPIQSDKSKPNQTNQSSSKNKPDTSQKINVDNPFSIPIGAAGIGGSSLAVISLWRQLQKLVGDPKKELIQYLNAPNYQSQVAFVEKFHKDFANIVKAYVGKEKVYVFIDDLDRCELPKSAELMQALNLMISEDPSIIFILGMDREKVAAGLAVKYKDLLPYLLSDFNSGDEKITESRNSLTGLEYGYAFIEKFVQLPFIVPQPSDVDLDHFLRELSAPPTAKISLSRRGKNVREQLIKTVGKGWRQLQQIIASRGRKSSRSEPLDLQKTSQSTSSSTLQTQEKPEEQKLERRQRIKLKVTEDSQTIRQIMSMVAPALDYNPRRLKQFINLFRLRTYIASDTGLFDEWVDASNNAAVYHPLTLEQLGKFTAISLKWPLILTDLENDPQLLAKLEKHLCDKSIPEQSSRLDIMPVASKQKVKIDRLIQYWGNRQKLKELLSYRILGDKSGEYNLEDYSLQKLEVDKLLQVSPKGGRRRDRIQSFTEDLGNQVSLEMLAIPGGSFLMGSPEDEPNRRNSESPQHEVTVSPFYMGQTPITQAQWREIASLRRVKRRLDPEPARFQGDDNRPVERVSWDDAVEFCARLSKLTGRDYRLPSEAEWEYACRAGTHTRYYFGDDKAQLGEYGWYGDNSGDTQLDSQNLWDSDSRNYWESLRKNNCRTHPVRQKKPNPWGLYDLHGNVWEWCADYWHDNYENAPTNGRAWLAENGGNSLSRMLRGGSWISDPRGCRSACRYNGGDLLNYSGFRVVCAPQDL